MTFTSVLLSVFLTTITIVSSIYGFTVNKDVRNIRTIDQPISTTIQPTNTYLTPLELIRKHGYPAEDHIVQSSDGYLLHLHRIPNGKMGPTNQKKIPILLYHGFVCSSAHWVISGPEKSLGYRLADAGYDVWMINARGNTFSRGHINYTIEDREFWEFSFHEMGIYDLPATIDYILNITKQGQLVYIGHSLGTTVFYVMASTLPEYSDKIKFQISLGPLAAVPHSTSSFKSWLPYTEIMKVTADWYNKGSIMNTDDSSMAFIDNFCNAKNFDLDACEEYFIGPFYGKDHDQFIASLFPLIRSYTPAGTSAKTMVHCSQLFSNNSFRQYDYGESENLEKYKNVAPPNYNLKKITVPMRLYYGENDIISNPTDTKLLYEQLSKPLGLVRVPYDKFNHADFLWAKDMNKLLNDELIEFINNSTDINKGSDFIQDNIKNAFKDMKMTNSVPDPVSSSIIILAIGYIHFCM